MRYYITVLSHVLPDGHQDMQADSELHPDEETWCIWLPTRPRTGFHGDIVPFKRFKGVPQQKGKPEENHRNG